MKITFHGAAKNVTGSKHLLETDGKKILLDCGLFQGHKDEVEELNRNFPFDPKELDYIVLSHAHIDHSGLIPYFVRMGFHGKIICSSATKDLVAIMLLDSGKIQEHDAEYMNAKNERHGVQAAPIEPLYTEEDVKKSLECFVCVNYNSVFDLSPNVTVTFKDAGHILGSSIIEIHQKEEDKILIFTGDLGRKGLPILRDPTQIDHADFLITESTYGNRMHDSVEGMENEVETVVKDTLKKGGKILIPAFSVGRTQEIVYLLHLLWDAGRIPKIPIYVDSPLSKKATEVFTLHSECYDMETFQNFLYNQHSPFSFGNLHYIQDVEESKKLNESNEPCIIISSSGMCENGRILHHLKRALPDSRNTVLIVGYMAQGTLGRRLIEKEKVVNIHGLPREVRAQIKVLNSFSAHADKDELFEFATHIQGLKKVFLVHGEEDQMIPYAERLRTEGHIPDVYIPAIHQTFTL